MKSAIETEQIPDLTVTNRRKIKYLLHETNIVCQS